MKLIDLSYFFEKSEKTPLQVVQEYQATRLFLEALSTHFDSVTAYRSYPTSSELQIGKVHYVFSPQIKSSRFSIPVKLHQQIRILNPDVILVHGWLYPLQVIHLRKTLGKNCLICIQHHAEKPAFGLKKWIQAWQFKYVDAAFFTSFLLAQQWFGAFGSRQHPQIYEVAEGASPFRNEITKTDKLSGNPSLLSVANLDENKDPITLLKAFAKLRENYPLATLHLVYKKRKLEQKLMHLAAELGIQNQVVFHGEVSHKSLGKYYRGADYFVSASHAESTGFAVIEAISCGCIPLVTRIPSHQKITDNGKIGALWEVANPADFENKFNEIEAVDKVGLKQKCLDFFDVKLSYESLGRQAYEAFQQMNAKH